MAGHIAEKLYHDPVHGTLSLPALCVRVIDTPQLQRLRYIKQLGGGYFVFPGASHNRFEHSVGVCHLAGELVSTLQARQPELGVTARDRLCVMVAGLCHDLGHGPFSHMFDRMFMPAARPQYKWQHEDASVALFRHLLTSNNVDLTVYGLCEPADTNFITELITGQKSGLYTGREKKDFLYQIVANKYYGMDVDKWDYIARDCRHMGLQASGDHLRLRAVCRVITDEEGVQRICFRDKEVGAVYEMYHTRAVLHQRACQHKTVVSIELMITDALLLADEHYKLHDEDGRSHTISQSVDHPAAYTHLTDHVYHVILTSSDPALTPARRLLERIERRQLYVCVGETLVGDRWADITQSDNRQLQTAIMAYDTEGVLREADVIACVVRTHHGMGDQDPVSGIRFYSKEQPHRAFMIHKDQVSRMLPTTFQDVHLRLYCRSKDPAVQNAAMTCFLQWCRDQDVKRNITNGFSSETSHDLSM